MSCEVVVVVLHRPVHIVRKLLLDPRNQSCKLGQGRWNALDRARSNREQMPLCPDTFDDLGGDVRLELQACLDFSKDTQDEFDGLVDMFTHVHQR